MKAFKLLSLISLLYLSIISCTSKQKEYEHTQGDKILFILDEKDLKNNNFYVIIPNAGCPGCITQAERFLLENIDSLNRTKFILTNFRSKKNIRIKLGAETINNPKIIFDHNSEFSKGGLNSIYPIIIYLIEGKIHNIEYINSDNPNALSKLKELAQN
jgi:hypothetical protein